MSKRDDSCLLDGGESVGMTNEQYKGMLLDELDAWERVLGLVVKAGNTEAQEEVQRQIAKINEKLKF